MTPEQQTDSDRLCLYADALDKDRGNVSGLTLAMRQAARALDALVAERDALAAEVERLRDKWEPDTDEPLPGPPSWEMLDKANGRWLAAEARVAALTEVLRTIAAGESPAFRLPNNEWAERYERHEQVARAALTVKAHCTVTAEDVRSALADVGAMERVVEAAREAENMLISLDLNAARGTSDAARASARMEEKKMAFRARLKLRAALAELDGQPRVHLCDCEKPCPSYPHCPRGKYRPFVCDHDDIHTCGICGDAANAYRHAPPIDERACPCRVHGDPDGDCGERCDQPSKRCSCIPPFYDDDCRRVGRCLAEIVQRDCGETCA